jgi:hypothetical protein
VLPIARPTAVIIEKWLKAGGFRFAMVFSSRQRYIYRQCITEMFHCRGVA